MKSSTWIALVAVVIVVVAWLLLRSERPAPMHHGADATITFKTVATGCDNASVSPDTIQNKKADTDVTWAVDNECGGEVAWDITGWKKNGSPNVPVDPPSSPPPTVPGHCSKSFKLHIKAKAEEGQYKYTVTWTSPGQERRELDPQLVISR